MMVMEFDWVPRVRVGQIHFGHPVQSYVEDGMLIYDQFPEELGGEDFYRDKEDAMSVHPDMEETNKLVDRVHCHRSLIFNGHELFGRPLSEVVEILGQEPDELGEALEVDEGDFQTTAEFDAVDLQLWLKDGISVGAVVGAFVDDEDE